MHTRALRERLTGWREPSAGLARRAGDKTLCSLIKPGRLPGRAAVKLFVGQRFLGNCLAGPAAAGLRGPASDRQADRRGAPGASDTWLCLPSLVHSGALGRSQPGTCWAADRCMPSTLLPPVLPHQPAPPVCPHQPAPTCLPPPACPHLPQVSHLMGRGPHTAPSTSVASLALWAQPGSQPGDLVSVSLELEMCPQLCPRAPLCLLL